MARESYAIEDLGRVRTGFVSKESVRALEKLVLADRRDSPSNELARIAEKAARGGLFLFAGNTSSIVILAIGSIIVARLLGPSGYGVYALTLLIPALLAAAADAGVNYALVRLPAKLASEGDHHGANRTVKLGFLIKLSISILAFLICYGFAENIAVVLLNRPQIAPLLRLASVLPIFQAVFEASSNSFVGLDLAQKSASIQILQSIVKTTLSPALVLVGFGVAGAISGHVLGFLAGGAAGASMLFLKYVHSSTTSPRTTSIPAEMRVLFAYSLPLYLATLLAFFLYQYQNVVLARFATNVEIGNFNAALNFNSLLVILAYPIITAMFPMFSKMDAVNHRSDIIRAFELAVKYTSLLILPASVAIMSLSRELVYVTYGKEFMIAPQYVILLSSLYLLTAVSHVILESFLNGMGDTRTVVKRTVLTTVLFLPLGPSFTLLWGPCGLITAFVVSNAVSTLYGLREASLKFGVRVDLNSSARTLLAALAAAVPTIILVRLPVSGSSLVNLTIGALVFLAAYVTLVPVLGAVDRFDIENLEVTVGRPPVAKAIMKPILSYVARILSMIRTD